MLHVCCQDWIRPCESSNLMNKRMVAKSIVASPYTYHTWFRATSYKRKCRMRACQKQCEGASPNKWGRSWLEGHGYIHIHIHTHTHDWHACLSCVHGCKYLWSWLHAFLDATGMLRCPANDCFDKLCATAARQCCNTVSKCMMLSSRLEWQHSIYC